VYIDGLRKANEITLFSALDYRHHFVDEINKIGDDTELKIRNTISVPPAKRRAGGFF